MAAELLPGIHWLGHATFRIEMEQLVIYFDPWEIKQDQPKADLILITHGHHDHCSPDDVAKLLKSGTVVVATTSCLEKLGLDETGIHAVKAGDKLVAKGVEIQVVPSYNVGKQFHTEEYGGVGYVIRVNDTRIYHAGDTDLIPEMKEIKTDIALLPIGGTYTMNIEEAAAAVSRIKPRIAVPMHYGRIVGEIDDAHRFAQLVEDAEVAVLPEEE